MGCIATPTHGRIVTETADGFGRARRNWRRRSRWHLPAQRRETLRLWLGLNVEEGPTGRLRGRHYEGTMQNSNSDDDARGVEQTPAAALLERPRRGGAGMESY